MLPSHSVSRLHKFANQHHLSTAAHGSILCPCSLWVPMSELLFALDLQCSSRRSKSEKADSADDWLND